MSDVQFPKDENLRLVLSTKQEQWLRLHIKRYITHAWAMAILLSVNMVWVAAYFSGAFSKYDEPGCYVLSMDAPDYQEMLNGFQASGLKPCPPESSIAKGINWTEVRDVVTASSLILILISSLYLFRNLYLLRQYRGYLNDHRAFLKKYNRL